VHSDTAQAETVLTARQQEIWQFLVEYVDGHGYPPTVREIGERVGLASPSTVHAHLANLERVGLIRRDPTKPRALELTGHRRVETETIDDVQRLPLLGRVAAGGPLLAEENVEDVIAVPESIGGSADFLLTVTGDSMIDAGILDGDLVVVEKSAAAKRGDIVIAIVDNQFTLKRLDLDRGRFVLKPENKAYPVIRPEGTLEIFGVMVGLVRKL
jgi:repressor LexA